MQDASSESRRRFTNTVAARIQPWATHIVVALVVIAALLRCVRVLDRRSLWFDEALLALNTCRSDLATLASTLSWDTQGPLGYLWLERGFCLLANGHEHALRAPTLLAGVLVPVMVWRVTKRFAGPVAQIVAVALAGFAPSLLRYSDEAKPYVNDAFFAIALMLCVVRLQEVPTDRRRWIALAVTGAVAIPFSMPVLFVLPACCLALFLDPRVRTPMLRMLVVTTALFVGTAILMYVVVQQVDMENPYMQAFFRTNMLRPRSPDFWSNTRGAAEHVLSSFFVGSFDPGRRGEMTLRVLATVPLVAFGTMILGAVFLVRRQASVLVLTLVPLLLAFMASMVSRYPIIGRTMLFSAPAFILLCAASVEWLMQRRRTAIVMAVSLMLMGPGIARAALEVREPIRRQHVRPLVQQFLATSSPNAVIYLSSTAIPSWLFYTTRWDRPDTVRLDWYARRGGHYGSLFHSARYEPPRGTSPVDSLVYRTSDRTEIAGRASGVFGVWGSPMLLTPPVAWAKSEAARIRLTRSQEAWVFFVPFSVADEFILGTLIDAIRESGGVEDFRMEQREAHLLRFRFD